MRTQGSRPRLPVYLGACPNSAPGSPSRTPRRSSPDSCGLRDCRSDHGGELFPSRACCRIGCAGNGHRANSEGRFEACLVGGVESYFQPDTMEWLDENRQLPVLSPALAFVPGEGAGFCLLMTEQALRRNWARGLWDACSRWPPARESKLIKTSDICLGRVLHRLSTTPSPACLALWKDQCGDLRHQRRTVSWRRMGICLSTLSQYFDDPTAYVSPADCWGDMGAASGPLFAMLACQAAARGYCRGSRTLLWASSEGGLRGAAVLGTDWGNYRRERAVMSSVGIHPPKTPVTKGSNGIAKATLPNVCKMPGPPAPFVPSPLPNIAKSGNSPKGYSTTSRSKATQWRSEVRPSRAWAIWPARGQVAA